jgi:hypothetical protein
MIVNAEAKLVVGRHVGALPPVAPEPELLLAPPAPELPLEPDVEPELAGDPDVEVDPDVALELVLDPLVAPVPLVVPVVLLPHPPAVVATIAATHTAPVPSFH